MEMDDGVYRIVLRTEDWSQGDLNLMFQFGEPEIDVGGSVQYLDSSSSSCYGTGLKDFGNEYVRIFHGFPYSRSFDSRDYVSLEHAISVGNAWKDAIVSRISNAVRELRAKAMPLPTEEIFEVA